MELRSAHVLRSATELNDPEHFVRAGCSSAQPSEEHCRGVRLGSTTAQQRPRGAGPVGPALSAAPTGSPSSRQRVRNSFALTGARRTQRSTGTRRRTRVIAKAGPADPPRPALLLANLTPGRGRSAWAWERPGRGPLTPGARRPERRRSSRSRLPRRQAKAIVGEMRCFRAIPLRFGPGPGRPLWTSKQGGGRDVWSIALI
jgi:hypothetical protein